jgi:hypothetical protein
LVSDALSEVASFAAVARSVRDALESLATALLASLEVPEMPCWTVSDAEFAAFLELLLVCDGRNLWKIQSSGRGTDLMASISVDLVVWFCLVFVSWIDELMS